MKRPTRTMKAVELIKRGLCIEEEQRAITHILGISYHITYNYCSCIQQAFNHSNLFDLSRIETLSAANRVHGTSLFVQPCVWQAKPCF